MKKIKEIRAAWKQQPDSFPVFLKENLDIFPYITSEQKKENEALIQEFSRRIQKKIQKKPREAEAQRQWEEELEQMRSIVEEGMQHAMKLRVPLIAEANIGRTWYDAK